MKLIEGDIEFQDESILELSPDERAHKGIFMSFQYPVEIPGVAPQILSKQRSTQKEKPKDWKIFQLEIC